MADSMRRRAWRNLLIATINAGLEQNLFTLEPDDNRWGRPHSTLWARDPRHPVPLHPAQQHPGAPSCLRPQLRRISLGLAAALAPDSERWIIAWPHDFLSSEAAADGSGWSGRSK
jgi:hypothetical protein